MRRRHAASTRRGSRLLRLVERLCVLGGVAALIWCAYAIIEVATVQRLAREELDSRGTRESARPEVPPDLPSPEATAPSAPETTPPGSSGRSVRPPIIANGTPLAELTMPRLGMSMVVLQGSDEDTLRTGPGHIETTPLPGEAGNVAIAGHRDSFFRPLRNVRIGDDILLETPEAHVRYRVSSFRVVNSHDVSVIAPTKDAALTLVTCYPFWFIGNAPDRFIVRAIRVDEPTGVAAASRAPAPDERSPGSRGKTGSLGKTNPNRVVESGPSNHTTEPAKVDPKARVRDAVERFKLRYNARLPQRGERTHEELMTFRFCDVSVSRNSAKVTCNSSAAAAPGSPVWTFKLARTGDDWNIKSVGTVF